MQEQQDLHNLNCFRFLQQISRSLRIQNLLSISGLFLPAAEVILFADLKKYSPIISYANLYHRWLSQLEFALEFRPDITQRHDFAQLIKAIYENDNHNLAMTYANIAETLAHRRLYAKRPETLLNHALQASSPQVKHQHTPQQAGSWHGRARSNLSSDFKPMLTTSLPTIRRYRYPTASMELRFGTQAQRHHGRVRLSPLFEQYIAKKDGPHLYFNLLGYDRFHFPASQERDLSDALHQAERDGKLYVLTLPADRGLMRSNEFKKWKPTIDKTIATAEMTAIAMGTSQAKTKDFVVSPLVKTKLYAGGSEQSKIESLLTASFTAMGLGDATILSPAQKQAVWFHFCKFEFPNMVLDVLKPSTWNASCKDAIDRGGVASAYYNLIKSFNTDLPMSHDEFEQALHAAAVMVKGRGLNHHYEMIWNAVHHYVNANFEHLMQSPAKSWLIHWRNDNVPQELAQSMDYLDKIHSQSVELITRELRLNPTRTGCLRQAQEIINEVKDLAAGERIHPKDRSFALEIISQTTQLALNPQFKKQHLPILIEAFGQRPIFANIWQKLLHWLRTLFVHQPKHQSELSHHLGIFQQQVQSANAGPEKLDAETQSPKT